MPIGGRGLCGRANLTEASSRAKASWSMRPSPSHKTLEVLPTMEDPNDEDVVLFDGEVHAVREASEDGPAKPGVGQREQPRILKNALVDSGNPVQESFAETGFSVLVPVIGGL